MWWKLRYAQFGHCQTTTTHTVHFQIKQLQINRGHVHKRNEMISGAGKKHAHNGLN